MYKVFVENNSIIFLSEKDLCILNIQATDQIVFSLKSLRKVLQSDSGNTFYVVNARPKIVKKEFLRTYLEIPAAGGIVQCKDEFLFIKRMGVWDIPKGKIEPEEDTELAAVREIEEECGIQKPVIQSKLIKTFHTYNFKGKKAVKKTTWYHLQYKGDKKTKPQIEEDIEEARWFKQAEFPIIKSNTYASILCVIQALEIELLKK
jgi:8-oxo-dGTP pyrophosphatase MutT (NUDIX family)